MAGDQIDEVEALKSELMKVKCLLFVAVRNTTVLPKGLLFGKNEKEIAQMTLDTIKEMETKVDFALVEKAIKMCEEAKDNGTAKRD